MTVRDQMTLRDRSYNTLSWKRIRSLEIHISNYGGGEGVHDIMT